MSEFSRYETPPRVSRQKKTGYVGGPWAFPAPGEQDRRIPGMAGNIFSSECRRWLIIDRDDRSNVLNSTCTTGNAYRIVMSSTFVSRAKIPWLVKKPMIKGLYRLINLLLCTGQRCEWSESSSTDEKYPTSTLDPSDFYEDRSPEQWKIRCRFFF